MHSKQVQSGSALVIISAIIVVVIVGGLGLVLWQKLHQKSESVVSVPTNFEECRTSPRSKLLETYPEKCVTKDGVSFTNTTQVPVTLDADLTEIATNSLDNRMMTLHYPSDWKASVVETGSAASEGEAFAHNTKIISPSSKFTIDFTIMKNGQYGGACDPDNVIITKLQTKSLQSAPKLRYAEVIMHHTFGTSDYYGYHPDPSDYYSYISEIERVTTPVAAVHVDGSGCDLSYAGLFKNETSTQPLAQVSIIAKGLESGQSPAQATITQALSGSEYDTAKRILLTLTDT